MLTVQKLSANHTGAAVVACDSPRPNPDQLLVKLLASAVCGTDRKIVDGSFPWRVAPQYPITLGHEGVGQVLESGSARDGSFVGRRIVPYALQPCGVCDACVAGNLSACKGPIHLGMNSQGTFAEYITVAASQCIAIPDAVPDSSAALLEALAIVARTFDRIHLQKNDTLAIIGLGPIGLLHMLAATRLFEAFVVMIGKRENSHKLAHAKSLGANGLVAGDDWAAAERAAYRFAPTGFDVVIEAALLGDAASLALRLVKPTGAVMLKGVVLGTAIDPLPIVRKHLSVFGQAGAEPRHYAMALDWIESGGLDISEVVTRWYSLADGDRTFAEIKEQGVIAGFAAAT